MQGCYYVGQLVSCGSPVYDELERKWIKTEKSYIEKLIDENCTKYGIAVTKTRGSITLFYKSAPYPTWEGKTYHKWQYTTFYFEVDQVFNRKDYSVTEKVYVSNIVSGNTDNIPEGYERTEEGYKKIV